MEMMEIPVAHMDEDSPRSSRAPSALLYPDSYVIDPAVHTEQVCDETNIIIAYLGTTVEVGSFVLLAAVRVGTTAHARRAFCSFSWVIMGESRLSWGRKPMLHFTME